MALTLQQVFDNAWRGLKKQGFKKCIGSHDCVYSNDEGNHCAIGWSLPPASLMNNVKGGIFFLVKSYEKEFKALFGADYVRLTELQRCHDGAKDGIDMKMRLESFASEYSLTIPQD